MEKEIKMAAQFIFDNAEEIAKWLNRKDIYRTVNIDFAKHYTGNVEVELKIYDEQGTHKFLKNKEITIETFLEICHELDREVGIIALAPQPELREKL